MKTLTLVLASFVLIGCASVRQEDLSAWNNQPISALETHPVFNTIPLVKTVTSDGTELWNFVNGAHTSSCSASAGITSNTLGTSLVSRSTIQSSYVTQAQYNAFSSCSARFLACNNIFTVKNGRVIRYTPIGTGGARCYTNDMLKPGFSGSGNIR